MKPTGFALKKIVLQVLILAVVAGAGISFAGPGGPRDPDTGLHLPSILDLNFLSLK